MPYIILLPIIVALVIVILGMRKKIQELEKQVGFFAKATEDGSKKAEDKTGFSEYNRKMKEQKEEGKNKILELLKKRESETPSNSPYSANRGRITNDDVQKLLGVSDATATNYLSELEKEDKIIQQEETGRGVFYILKNG
jgi:Fic family protein